MICEKTVRLFVRKGELEKIENYDKAIADKSQTWHCHHRLELTLDGEFAHSAEELKRMGMYYNRPYFELIFLTRSEHHKIHGNAQSEEQKKKIGKATKDNPRSAFGRKYFEHYGYSRGENLRQYLRERMWYINHNNVCRWE